MNTEQNQHVTLGPHPRSKHYRVDESLAVKNIIRGPGLMIDVGAHHGSACLPFLDIGWNVHAFEPCVKTREILIKKIGAHSNSSRCIINSVAVGNKPQSNIPFFESEESSGISGLSAFLPSHYETDLVDVITLSDYLKQNELSNVDFLKIDTEGHDFFVLQGYPLVELPPKIIECEFEDHKTLPLGYSWKDMANFLIEFGYQVWISEWHPVIKYGVEHDWCALHPYPCDLFNENGWGNILAFKDPISKEIICEAFLKSKKNINYFDRILKLLRSPRKIINYIRNRIR